jgi:hypothetical protein
MQFTFVGTNIKGTPAMPAAHVRHDLRKIKAVAHVFGVQEFTWPWYWRSAIAVLELGSKWSGFPNRFVGAATPSIGAQAIFWSRKKFRKVKGYAIPAYDFSVDTSGIMRNRYIRAALLEARGNKFRSWFLSTHFVVGGDNAKDGPVRKDLLRQNIANLDKALTHLVRSGYPIMGEFDGNIHKHGSWAFDELMAVLNKHDAVLHGEVGVEYAFTIDNTLGVFQNVEASTIPTSELYTDHEARVLTAVGVPTQPHKH